MNENEVQEVSTEVQGQDNDNSAELISQLERLNTNLESMAVSEDNTEEVTEQATEEESVVEQVLTLLDPTVDNNLYLSSKVENATINDLYSIELSIRNIGLLAFFMFLAFMCYRMVRATMERMLSR